MKIYVIYVIYVYVIYVNKKMLIYYVNIQIYLDAISKLQNTKEKLREYSNTINFT